MQVRIFVQIYGQALRRLVRTECKSMKETLQVRLQEKQYREMLRQYHFRQSDLEQLICLGDILQRTAQPVMYYAPCHIDGGETPDDQNMTSVSEKERAASLRAAPSERVQEGTQLAVIVTLGARPDALQNEYVAKERLTEGYMIECLGMELLKAAYEMTAQKLWEKYGLWLSGFSFLGEQYPLEWTQDIFRLLAPEGISYNQAYMLAPKKTVVFVTTLQREREDGYCRVCDACGNLQCPNRYSAKTPDKEREAQEAPPNLNYGYQRIFGKP